MQIVVNGLLTQYNEYGDKNNSTLIILHGWGQDLATWESVSKILAKKYHVIALDLPGFGGTSIPKKTFSIYDYADFVQEFIKKIEVDKFHLLGHSFGGRISIILASRGVCTEKLILVASAGIEDRSNLYKNLIDFVRPVVNVLPKTLVEKFKNTFGSKDYLTSGELKDIFIKVINQDLTHHLKDIHNKTLVVWGNKDSVLDVNLVKKFRNGISDCLVRIIWGAGHSPHVEVPETLANFAEEFLDDK